MKPRPRPRKADVDLVGRRWRLTTTGHCFFVIRIAGEKAEVLEGCFVRRVEVALLRRAYKAGLLELEA